MNNFDTRARDWDNNKMHQERAQAIADALLKMISLTPAMNALDYGAGTGLLSFALKDYLGNITLMDNSKEMMNVAREKIVSAKISNMQALQFDLEHESFAGKFDLIYNQMVLHHIHNTEQIIDKFYSILNHGGYLAIADLYAEDGSFHGKGFSGHNGFDIENLTLMLQQHGFGNIKHQTCFFQRKQIENGEEKEFPVFLLVAEKSK